jgi:HAD superfamily, subfamily IIIB (Acid phosphatase)
MYIITDIDHTVSNSFWRDEMLNGSPINWDEYHSYSRQDKPFKKTVNLINSLSSTGYEIIGLTGRPEKFRQLTVNWLITYKIDVDELLMRPDDNFTKNMELKVMLLKKRFCDDFKKIHFIIDDNEEAAIAFFKLGITTLQIRNIKDE